MMGIIENIFITDLRNFRGCYILLSNKIPVYIGRSKNIFERVGTHIARGIKSADYTMDFDSVIMLKCNDDIWLEQRLISILKPKYNSIKLHSCSDTSFEYKQLINLLFNEN